MQQINNSQNVELLSMFKSICNKNTPSNSGYPISKPFIMPNGSMNLKEGHIEGSCKNGSKGSKMMLIRHKSEPVSSLVIQSKKVVDTPLLITQVGGESKIESIINTANQIKNINIQKIPVENNKMQITQQSSSLIVEKSQQTLDQLDSKNQKANISQTDGMKQQSDQPDNSQQNEFMHQEDQYSQQYSQQDEYMPKVIPLYNPIPYPISSLTSTSSYLLSSGSANLSAAPVPFNSQLPQPNSHSLPLIGFGMPAPISVSNSLPPQYIGQMGFSMSTEQNSNAAPPLTTQPVPTNIPSHAQMGMMGPMLPNMMLPPTQLGYGMMPPLPPLPPQFHMPGVGLVPPPHLLPSSLSSLSMGSMGSPVSMPSFPFLGNNPAMPSSMSMLSQMHNTNPASHFHKALAAGCIPSMPAMLPSYAAGNIPNMGTLPPPMSMSSSLPLGSPMTSFIQTAPPIKTTSGPFNLSTQNSMQI